MLQTFCHLSTNNKNVSEQFLETYGISIYGSDWGKDAWSLEDGLSSEFALVLSLVHTVCVNLS